VLRRGRTQKKSGQKSAYVLEASSSRQIFVKEKPGDVLVQGLGKNLHQTMGHSSKTITIGGGGGGVGWGGGWVGSGWGG